MIEGEIKESDGAVTLNITATVSIAGTLAEIEFLIDTGAYATVICPKDQAAFLVNSADALRAAHEVAVEGVGGNATFRAIPAILTFHDSETGVPWAYRTQIYMAEPSRYNRELPSLLGMDILRHWIPQGISADRPAILFAPKSA